MIYTMLHFTLNDRKDSKLSKTAWSHEVRILIQVYMMQQRLEFLSIFVVASLCQSVNFQEGCLHPFSWLPPSP